MKILMLMFLLFGSLPQMDEYSDHRIHVITLANSTTTTFGVRIDQAQNDEEVIVDICYKQSGTEIGMPTIPYIVRCKTSVVPAIEGALAATDDVPVSKDKIVSVKIKVAKIVNQAEFKIGPLE